MNWGSLCPVIWGPDSSSCGSVPRYEEFSTFSWWVGKRSEEDWLNMDNFNRAGVGVTDIPHFHPHFFGWNSVQTSHLIARQEMWCVQEDMVVTVTNTKQSLPQCVWEKVHLIDYGFSSGHVWMWDLDYKESWAPKNWCFWTVVLEKTLESPLEYNEIHSVNPKGGQSWVFIGRTDVEAETPILWPPDAKKWLIWKDPDAGKDWRQEEKGMTEDEIVGWHHRFNGHESE